MVSSGLRVGAPALATRGVNVADFHEVGAVMAAALTPEFDGRRDELAERAAAVAERYPLYAHLGEHAAV
jgi:glycine hydroxymethyltransferase